MKYKNCTKCGGEYPATAEFFHVDKQRKDELHPQCKICCRKYQKWHYQENKIACLQQHKKWRELNPDYMSDYYSTIEGYLRHAYSNIKGRCTDLRAHNYSCYGGAGVKNLFKSFKIFKEHCLEILNGRDPHGLEVHRTGKHYCVGGIEFLIPAEHRAEHVELRQLQRV